MNIKNKLFIMAMILNAWAVALPPTNPDNPLNPVLPPLQYSVSGSAVVKGCGDIKKENIRVSLTPGITVPAKTSVALASGGFSFSYAISVSNPATGTYKVKAQVVGGECSGAIIGERVLQKVPASGINFNYMAPGVLTKVGVSEFLAATNLFLALTKLHLHNHKAQESFVKVLNTQVNFNVAKAVVDLDCGILCPDVGDGEFYINDLNLSSAQLSWVSPHFLFSLNFEDQAREIKGYHSSLGDSAMPDFDLTNIKMAVKALLRVTTSGKLTFGFTEAKLSSGISSTGGCNIFGIDICEKLFSTDDKIRKAANQATEQALNSSAVQTALMQGFSELLTRKGIMGKVIDLRIVGSEIHITTK